MRIFPATRPIWRMLLALIFAIVACGCYKATFITNPSVVRGADHDQWHSFFLFVSFAAAARWPRFGRVPMC